MMYRKEIDGLRAIAVLPVILFHAGFEIFSGGFIGVDIFFVISGYLITTIILEDLENKRFSMLKFYERRARRILPALFFVMFCCIPFAWVWMLPSQFSDFSQSIIAVSVFASNIFFWKTSGYFDVEAEQKPLLHTWSLAVEEQYYLFFPLFMILLWRFGRDRVFWVIVIFSAISFFAAEWGWRNKPLANFYLVPTRAWELFAGSLAAFIIQKQGVARSNLLSFLGFVAIFISILVYDSNIPFPSVYALLPVVGVLLIIMYGNSDTIIGKLLSNRVLVAIGLVSYSAYLWHQPLFAFARIRLVDEPTPELMLFLSIFSLVLALFTWKFIEQPFRGNDPILKQRFYLFGASTASLAIFIGFGIYGYLNVGFPSRWSKDIITIANYENDKNPYYRTCNIVAGMRLPSHPLDACKDFFIGNRAEVMFVGDSHSSAISYQAQSALKSAKISSYAVSYTGCIGIKGFYRVDLPITHICDAYNKQMLKYARETGISTIVITSRFALYYYGVFYNNGEGGVEHSKPSPINLVKNRGYHEEYDSKIRKLEVLKHLKRSIEKLSKEFNVVLVYPIPEVGWNVVRRLTKCSINHRQDCKEITTSYLRFKERTKAIKEIFDNLAGKNIYRVQPSSILCNTDGRCIATKEGRPLYFDDDHLANSTGARMLAPLILNAVKTALKR